MKIRWATKHFTQLSSLELYHILQLRSRVFVVEQRCIYTDIDNYDKTAYHIMGFYNGTFGLANGTFGLATYSRIFPTKTIYSDYQSIGRVVCAPEFRKNKIGNELMTKSISECNRIFGKGPIKIGAQYYLVKFYETFGFKCIGEKYDEDGIDHITMIR